MTVENEGRTNVQQAPHPSGTITIGDLVICPCCGNHAAVGQLIYERRDHTGLPGQRRALLVTEANNGIVNHNVDIHEIELAGAQ